MLLNNKEKVVELFIENLLAGMVSGSIIDAVVATKETLDPKRFDYFIDNIKKWYNLKGSDSDDFKQLTNFLFETLLRGRIMGIIKGVFKEIPELEKQLEQCNQDNIILADKVKEQSHVIAAYEAGMHQSK